MHGNTITKIMNGKAREAWVLHSQGMSAGLVAQHQGVKERTAAARIKSWKDSDEVLFKFWQKGGDLYACKTLEEASEALSSLSDVSSVSVAASGVLKAVEALLEALNSMDAKAINADTLKKAKALVDSL